MQGDFSVLLNYIVLFVLLMCTAVIAELKGEVGRLNRKLTLLLQHHKIDPQARVPLSGQAREEVVSLIKAKKKVEAIKVYRQHTDAGLKEARDAVEEMTFTL